MPQDGDLCCYESFNSFFAGVLLTRKKISNFDFCDLLNKFENYYNVCIISKEGDADICLSIYFDDNCITLINNYDEFITVNGREMTVASYLYSITSSRVREFFCLIPLEEKVIKKDSFIKKIFKLKVKTKVYV